MSDQMTFDPIRDFFQRRQRALLDVQARALQLVIDRSEPVRGNFCFPGPDIDAAIQHQGEHIGRVWYGFSPLQDRLYIYDIEINSRYQGRGFGQVALWLLWSRNQLPLTPLYEVMRSHGFWAKVRKRFAAAGVTLTRDLRTGEQEVEQQRWQHLVSETDAERLNREYWEGEAAKLSAGQLNSD